MSRQFPPAFQCEECGAILREIMDAARSDAEAHRNSGDPVKLRNELLAADDFQFQELHRAHYARTIEARRRKDEHEILTGHSVILHGARTAGLGRRF